MSFESLKVSEAKMTTKSTRLIRLPQMLRLLKAIDCLHNRFLSISFTPKGFRARLQESLSELESLEGVKPPQISGDRIYEYELILRQLGIIDRADQKICINSELHFGSESISLGSLVKLLDRVVQGYNRKSWYMTRTRYEDGGDILHRFLAQRHRPYAQLIDILQENPGQSSIDGLSAAGIDEVRIIEICKQSKSECFLTNIGRVEVFAEWGQYFGTISKNQYFWKELFTTQKGEKKKRPRPRYYPIEQHFDVSSFQQELENTYFILKRLLAPLAFVSPYVEITLLREFVCENLRIHREDFDNALVSIWKQNLQRYELVKPAAELTRYGSVSAERQFEKRGAKIHFSASRHTKDILPPLTVGRNQFYYIRIGK